MGTEDWLWLTVGLLVAKCVVCSFGWYLARESAADWRARALRAEARYKKQNAQALLEELHRSQLHDC